MNTLYFLFGTAVGVFVSLLLFALILNHSKEIRFESEIEADEDEDMSEK